MPYLKQENRYPLYDGIDHLGKNIENAGDLNFAVTSIIDAIIGRKGLNYAILNEYIGALECVKQELYRRIAGPYEDQKIVENGDAYSFSIDKLREKGQY